MAINWTTLFARLGKGYYLANLLHEFRGAAGSGAIATDLPTEWEDYVEQFDGTGEPYRSLVSAASSQLGQARSQLGTLVDWVRSSTGQLLIETTDANNPLVARDLQTALAELVVQMRADSKTVDANATSITVTPAGGNVGNGKARASLVDGYGITRELVFDEDLVLTFTSTATAGREAWQVRGETAQSDRLAHNWPLGSGANKSGFAVDAATTTDNKIANGGFETFTVANTPDSWTIQTGTAGVEVFSEASTIYKGAKALRIAGAATNTALYQALSNVSSKTPYCVNFWCKCSGTPAAGVLTVELHDGTSTITNEQGTAQSFTVDLTTLGTTYVDKGGFFQLPEPLPATVRLRLRLSTALSAGTNLYIDHLAFTPAAELYTGGPYLAVFSGATNYSLDDSITLAVANDYAGELQNAFWRYYDTPAYAAQLPSNGAGAENILDTVIS